MPASGGRTGRGFLGGLATTNHGGQPRIARGPNQGISCSRNQKTLEKTGEPCIGPAFSGAFPQSPENTKGWRPFRASSPWLERNYLSSALAPASSSFFLAASASALAMASLTGFGAPS